MELNRIYKYFRRHAFVGIILCLFALYVLYRVTYKDPLKPKSDYPKNLVGHLHNISVLSHKNDAHIFPRKGFLLGVIRHNGFLPNEGIDADLACLDNDISKILQSDWGEYEISANTKFGDRWDKDFFDGKHPLTRMPLDYYSLKITHKPSSFKETIMIYYSLNEDEYFYPGHFIKGYNSEKEFKLNSESYYKKNGGIKIISEKGVLPLKGLYENPSHLGRVGTVYHKSSFRTFLPHKLYDKHIYVPSGSREILISDYGEDVFDVIINKDGTRENIR